VKPILAKEWLPDLAFYNNHALFDAKNVIPGGLDGFKPLQSLSAVTDAMAARVRGARTFRLRNTALSTLAGTKEKLYKLSATLTWTDISDATYTTEASDGIWSFAQYGTKAIMTNLADNVKVYDIVTAPATVGDLAGTPPKAKFVCTVRNQVFLAHLSSDEAAIHWSGFNNCEQWTAGSNLSDTQSFPEGGRIMGCMGGDVGYFFQERMTRAAIEAPGSPTIYDIPIVSEDRGLAAYQGIVQIGNSAWMLANDGFFLFSRGQYKPIGTLKVDEWFYDNAESKHISRTVVGVDPKKKLVFWAFISTEADSSVAVEVAVCDKVLIYNWVLDQWAWAEVSISAFVDIANQSVSLDSLDTFGTMETLPAGLDAAVWNADSISSLVGAFGSDFKLSYFTGDNMEAIFQYKNLHFFPPRRQLFRSAWPVCDASNIMAAISGRDALSDTESFGSYVSKEDNGHIPLDDSAMTHDVKFKIPAAATWTHFRGFYPDVIPDGDG
jgi:hypothetical protein